MVVPVSRCKPATPWTTKNTKYHEGFRSQAFPSCTFVPLVVNVFAIDSLLFAVISLPSSPRCEKVLEG
jgi:hypothetical protein